jgi:phage antirepressor YoqD-like protein
MAKAAKKDKKSNKKVKTFTTSDVAEELGIEAKTLRVWLRDNNLGVGRGKQYKFSQKQRDRILEEYRNEDEVEDDETDDED